MGERTKRKENEMTKDTFINAWSRELSIESSLSTWDAKRFLDEFYSAVVGFHKDMKESETWDKHMPACSFGTDICMVCGKTVDEHFTKYGTYDGQRFPVGTVLTSDESGRIIEAPKGTPEERIVHTVKKDS